MKHVFYRIVAIIAGAVCFYLIFASWLGTCPKYGLEIFFIAMIALIGFSIKADEEKNNKNGEKTEIQAHHRK